MTRGAVKGNWIDRLIEPIFPGWAFKRIMNRQALQLSGRYYRGADSTRLRSDWAIGATESTPPIYELSVLRNRSRDLNRNDAVASGITDTLGINIGGQGLSPQARIRADRLEITEDKAQELCREAEAAWDLFCPYADAGYRLDMDEIQFLAIRKVIEDGEVLALPIWDDALWRPFGRCLELIEAERLESPSSSTASYGIELGNRGQPLAYHIRKMNWKQAWGPSITSEYSRIPARDDRGRLNVIHVFPSKRVGQLRGVPWFAPVLGFFNDLNQYLEAEVVAARVAACLAVFITQQDPMQMGLLNASGTETDTGHRYQNLEPGLVGYLRPGEAVNVVDPKRPGQTFDPFLTGLLRLIGAALNMPYELMIKDFSKTNYSSARAALLEGRRMFMTWRKWFARKFLQPIYEFVLEEAWARGLFSAKDFYRFKAEYCRAIWIGGGWGWIDPTKEVEASKMAVDYGLSTLAEEAAAQGRDWEEVLEQRARKNARIDELGLVIPMAKGAPAKPEGGSDAETEEK